MAGASTAFGTVEGLCASESSSIPSRKTFAARECSRYSAAWEPAGIPSKWNGAARAGSCRRLLGQSALSTSGVRAALKSHVDYRQMDVYDLSPETVGQFDIVLFMGVFYHLKAPSAGA